MARIPENCSKIGEQLLNKVYSKHAGKMTQFNLHNFNVSITTVQFKECQPK